MPQAPLVHSWWAQRWLRLLDEMDWEWQGRLARGRTYARNGSVQRVEIRAGGVAAQVRGSYWELYRTELRVPIFPPAVWRRVLDRLAGEAFYAAKLFARELPPEIEEIVAQAGGALFPAHFGEVAATCTCGDPIRPCKHIFAVHYALAMKLDYNPSLLLLLRGKSGEEITSALRARWNGEIGAAAAAEETEDDDTQAALSPARFFEPGPELEAFAASFHIADAPPQADAALLLRLGKPPFAAAGEEPYRVLAPAYKALSARAIKILKRSGQYVSAKQRPAALPAEAAEPTVAPKDGAPEHTRTGE
jgi:uncharacterized Zn finger protein